MECLLFAGGECWIKDDFLKVVLSWLPVFLPFGVCINAGRGELTLFTSASCCIKISSVFSFSDTVVTAGSVSMAVDSDWLLCCWRWAVSCCQLPWFSVSVLQGKRR
jgi:hypothetical protein